MPIVQELLPILYNQLFNRSDFAGRKPVTSL